MSGRFSLDAERCDLANWPSRLAIASCVGDHLDVDMIGWTATSPDGRRLTVTGSVEPPALGEVVLVESDGATYVAQVLDAATGTGDVLGRLDSELGLHRDQRRPFGPSPVLAAGPEHLEAIQGPVGGLTIGAWTSGSQQVPARLRTATLNRHTFLCGQSGSGKTYALGVLLEQALCDTDLRTIVLDPNADFVRMGEDRPGADPVRTAHLRRHGLRVLTATQKGGLPLRLRFTTMPRKAQAAVLRLDPVVDRTEYHLFVSLMSRQSGLELDEIVTGLLAGGADEQALGQRIANLGLLDWEVWAGEQESAAELIGNAPGMSVLDLSGFEDPSEPWAVTLDLVESLWARREERVPTLLVIDEAHNLCPPHPDGPLQEALVSRLVQIAAEGRKYGLWLLLSTQRPSKIHPQVLTQCDNLLLMRMNSAGDVAELAEVFGFAPPAMVAAARTFVQGEALVAGGLAPVPSLVRMGDRLTVEGGQDVPVPVVTAP